MRGGLIPTVSCVGSVKSQQTRYNGDVRRTLEQEAGEEEVVATPPTLDYGTYPKWERSREPFTWQQILLLAVPMLVLACLLLLLIGMAILNHMDM